MFTNKKEKKQRQGKILVEKIMPRLINEMFVYAKKK